MSSNGNHFCPMRSVRTYLRKIDYLLHATKIYTYRLFRENTQYYLEGKITKKFYSVLAQEFLYQAKLHALWRNHDNFCGLLKIVAVLENIKTKNELQKINSLLMKYLYRRNQPLFLQKKN